MKKFDLSKLIVAATLLSAGTTAQADTLAGVGWSANQNHVVCYLFNAGPGTVTITGKSIIREPGGSSYSLSGSCGSSLAAYGICAFSANVPGDGANACRAVISPSGANVRGTMEIRTSSGTILNSIPLR